MSTITTNDELKPKVTKGDGSVEDKNKGTATYSKIEQNVPEEQSEGVPSDSLNTIGHVPLPGSGGGKGTSGTSVKKKQSK
ncbi:MAG: hypothetical protein Q4G10_01090 [Bacteroidia bacterium]|nr:hypothetical protein [Bacteroidia bacterium]